MGYTIKDGNIEFEEVIKKTYSTEELESELNVIDEAIKHANKELLRLRAKKADIEAVLKK